MIALGAVSFTGFSIALVLVAIIGAVRAGREAERGIRSRTSAALIAGLYLVGVLAFLVLLRPYLIDMLNP